MNCTQSGCTGPLQDGYCNVCGLAPASGTSPVVAPPAAASAGPMTSATSGGAAAAASPAAAMSARASSTRLGTVALGSQRSTTGSRRTQRLGSARGASSRLGAGLTTVPPVPAIDPMHALMDPAVVEEDKRHCGACQAPVGRARGAEAGRTKGFCPKCRIPFDFDPRLKPGMLVGGQYEVAGCLAHGGMGWIYLARDRNVNGRWVVLKGLLNSGDPDAFRAAVSEKQFLAEVEHPLIVEIYNFVTAPDGASYIVMEYIGGTSLNNLVKQRTAQNNGVFTPPPPDQAIAFIVEVLPAFSYLHNLGLIYCDFKPANIIQIGDGVKLIDLGGVRRIDDNDSPIYGTVGYQAPEVAADGPSVSSDIYTIARTLAVLTFEFRRSTSDYIDRLPGPDQVPLFAQHDSFYRLLLKGTAPNPADRFQSADELREQLLGVLRELTARDDAEHRSTPSGFFEAPSISTESLEWSDMPRLRVDADDPMASWLAGVAADDPGRLVELLKSAPTDTAAVRLARASALLHTELSHQARGECEAILAEDPWDWRAVWVTGLAALHAGDFPAAISAFNAVYGQIPGELAPKLALGRACELAGEADMASRLYSVCARVDATYVAPAQFGLARIAVASGRPDEALGALGRIPTVSRAYGAARRRRAQIMADGADATPEQLAAAVDEARAAGLPPVELLGIENQILSSAVALAVTKGPRPGVRIGGVAMEPVALRSALEAGYRNAARLTDDRAEKIRLVDLANRVRPRTLV